MITYNLFYFSIIHHLLCLSCLARPATTFVAHSCKKLICGVIRSFYSIADVARYNSRQRLSLHIATAAQHPFTSSLSDISSQAALQSPGFEHENLDRQKPGMLIANMFCTFVQIPSQLGSFFSALQINDLFLVVYWNQFVPQQGSYIQTFKVLI